MRILIFTPVFPKHNKGAAEQDQLYGALHLQQMGHTVRMAAFLPKYQSVEDVTAYGRQMGLEVTAFPYPEPQSTTQRLTASIKQPALLDGAAYQHAHPKLLAFAAGQIDSFKPDVVWLDNDFLWPVALMAKKQKVPVITRSQNFEPEHVLDESGRTPLNYLRAGAKYLGELAALRYSDLLVAITPIEQARYSRLSQPEKIKLLPLRGLPAHLRPPRPPVMHTPLQVFYWGSTYNVSHNRAALEFVVSHIWPRVRTAAPNDFCLNIFGGKVPAAIQSLAADDLVIHGFVPDLEAELNRMDIALVPSLYGCGMQQKVFEPLCRGFPEVTSLRGLAGYTFDDGIHVLTANTADEFAAQLVKLRDPALRTMLAANASQRAQDLFSKDRQTQAHEEILKQAVTA